MIVTDEMVQIAACVYLGKSEDCTLPSGNTDDMRKALEAALSTIKPMTAREIDSMMQRGCIDDTVDLVEAVEYWHGIRE
jgi:hypothetical protein